MVDTENDSDMEVDLDHEHDLDLDTEGDDDEDDEDGEDAENAEDVEDVEDVGDAEDVGDVEEIENGEEEEEEDQGVLRMQFGWPLVQLVSAPRGWALKKLKFGRIFYQQLANHRPGVRGEETTIAPEGSPPTFYWMLVALRFLLALVPQGGCLHPDEFFQTLEPVAGSLLDLDWTQTWEFNATFPIRNMALQYVTIGIPLKLLTTANELLSDYINFSWISPYSIVVVPRIFYCLLSFVNDICLYKICKFYGIQGNKKLVILASSYVTLVYCTRTFSNSIEVVLVSLLLYIVTDCMRTSKYINYHKDIISDKYKGATEPSDKARYHKLRLLLPDNSFSQCLQIATISVIGIFNRPTFIAFAFPSIFLWLLRGLGTRHTGFKDFHQRLVVFIFSCLPALLFMIIFDSAYYKYLTISDIEAKDISMNNFVVTPLNFLKYNLFSSNLAKHGLHSRWLHVLINIPLLFNVLGVIAVFSGFRCVHRLAKGYFHSIPRIQTVNGLMTFSILIPVMILSMFPHQEPRFLIPLQIPIIMLITKNLQHTRIDRKWEKKFKTFLFIIGLLYNVILTIFFGFIHQGGIYPVAKHIHMEVSAKPKFMNIHIVTSHMYDLPQTLFMNKDTTRIRYDSNTKKRYKLSKQTFLYELHSKPLKDVLKQIKVIWDVSHRKVMDNRQMFRLYLILPSSLRYRLYSDWEMLHDSSFALVKEESFFPHLSTEALPRFPAENDPSCISDYQSTSNVTLNVRLTKFGQLSCFLRQFSLAVYKIDKKSNYVE